MVKENLNWRTVKDAFPELPYIWAPLPPKEFVDTETHKDGIIRHCTVSSSVKYLRDIWAGDKQGAVATHYAVEKDGTVYQFFAEEDAAFHTGLGLAYDQNKFGIEICNEAFLRRVDGQFLWQAGSTWKLYNGKVFTSPKMFQGYNYWAGYTPEQVDSTAKLIAYLCYKHGIKLEFCNVWEYLGSKAPKTGILNHSNISTQRADPGPAYPYEQETKLAKGYFEMLCRKHGFPIIAKKP